MNPPPFRANLSSLPPPAPTGADECHRQLKQGTAGNPRGVVISADGTSLLRDGRRWMPVMGEMQFSRCERTQWRDGLLKMKAAGIDIVATYIFWIHHEEIEGRVDFSGSRSLRDFASLCAELGLLLQVRCGPWAHGECRNGGFPDWLLNRGHLAAVPKEAEEHRDITASPAGIGVRSNDPGYIEIVRHWYNRIAAELTGLLWKDGGPVIGLQIENEYPGPAEHLLTLKQLARDAGMDVPLYTYTGWPKAQTPMPFGEMLPLYGIYAEGFWDRSLEPMPGNYWEAFEFKPNRVETTIATDHFGHRHDGKEGEAARYPYLTCELGGGMMTSYHRRVRVEPKDVVAPALVKLGSGNNLPGFYVFHGGTNPDAASGFLNESQASGYPNDLPVKSYDFQAPVGEFGQVREHYHWLRRMNLFIREFGEGLAAMRPVFAGASPKGKNDTATLRWAVRSDGSRGFIFCNNYQKLQPMGSKEDVQFRLEFKERALLVPSRPINVPADSFFIWPVNLDLGGVALAYSTAEAITCLADETTRTYFFAATAGVPAEFAFDAGCEVTTSYPVVTVDGLVRVSDVVPGLDVAMRVRTPGGQEIRIVLLGQETSLTAWKLPFGGRDRMILASGSLLADGGSLRLQAPHGARPGIAVFPAPAAVHVDGAPAQGESDGIFARFRFATGETTLSLPFERVATAAPARVVPLGRFHVAEAPPEKEFARAAVWKVRLPRTSKTSGRTLLRFHYVGDVARVYLDGRLLTDNFYNGSPFEVDLGLTTSGDEGPEILLKVLPLRGDAPIYLPVQGWAASCGPEGTASLSTVELLASDEVRLDCPR